MAYDTLVPDEKFETLQDQKNAITQSTEDSDVPISFVTGAKKPKEKKGEVIAHMRGEAKPRVPGALVPVQAKAIEAEKSFEYAKGLSTIKAGSLVAQSYSDYSDYVAKDAKSITELNDKHFSKWDAESTKFKQEIDEARAMKVNPNRYYQSIGTGGRVASTFAVGVSQLAAGAGNVSSVMKRIDSAIDRDVAAQEYNIKQAWMGVAQMQNQQSLERQMFADYMTFKDRAKSYHYTAMAAKIGAIKQNAENEMAFLAYQMIEDRFNAAAIKSIADALAAMGTIYIDMPIRNMADALRAKGFAEQAQQLMAMDQGAIGAPLDPTILQMSNQNMQEGQGGQPGTLVGPQGPIAPGQAPAGALAAPQPTQAAPQAAPKTRAGSAGGRTRPTTSGFNADMTFTPEEAGATPAEPTTPDQGPPQGETHEAKLARVKDEANASLTPLQQEAGSSAKHEFKDLTETAAWPTREESIDKLAEGVFATAHNEADADAIRRADKQLYPPVSLLPTEVTAKLRGKKKLNDKEAALVARDNRRMQVIAARQKNNDYYMARRSVKLDPTQNHPDSQNYVVLGDGSKLFLKEDSIARAQKENYKAAELRGVIAGEYDKVLNYVTTIAEVSDIGMSQGAGSILGLFSFDEQGHISVVPTRDKAYLEGAGFSEGISNFIGAKVMKMLDPSGRLTDMDIRVGRAIGLAMKSGMTNKAVDSLNAALQFFKLQDENEFRLAMQATMKRVTMAVVDSIWEQGPQAANVLRSPAASASLSRKREAADKWLQTRYDPNAPKIKEYVPPKAETYGKGLQFRPPPEQKEVEPTFWNQPLLNFGFGEEDDGTEDSTSK